MLRWKDAEDKRWCSLQPDMEPRGTRVSLVNRKATIVRILRTALTFGLALALSASAWGGTIYYSSLPLPLPANIPGLNYEATGTSELGDAVFLADGYSGLQNFTVTVGLTSSATYANYGAGSYSNVTTTSSGYTYPVTLTLYAPAEADPALGTVIASQTVNAFIPWLPADSSDHRISSTVSFNFAFTGSTSLPHEFIYGLSFNTKDYGADPTIPEDFGANLNATGEAGPYDCLGFALSSAVTMGEQVTPGTVFWSTSDGSYDAFFENEPTNTFEQTTGTGWAGYVPAVEISLGTVEANIVPEPISMIFFGTGLVAVGGYVARRRMLRKA